MIEEILLLSDPVLIPELKAVLNGVNVDLKVNAILTRKQLDERCQGTLKNTRMVSFGSDIIVPEAILNRVECGAYNFHPGPPTYPGRFPSSFFLYEGGTRFGSTVHEMAPKVDSGAINAVDWFDVPPNVDCVTLNAMSFRSLFTLFKTLSPHLARNSAPLSRISDTWQGRPTTQKDFNALCRLPSDVSEAEFKRRYRAVGEGPDHALEMTLFGHRFSLDNQHTAPDVLIGATKR